MYHNVGIHQHTEVALLKGSNPVDAQYPIRTARDYSIGTLSLRGFLYLAIKFGWPTVARGLSMMRLVSGFIETISKAGNPIPDPQPVAGGLWRSQRGVLVLVPFRWELQKKGVDGQIKLRSLELLGLTFVLKHMHMLRHSHWPCVTSCQVMACVRAWIAAHWSRRGMTFGGKDRVGTAMECWSHWWSLEFNSLWSMDSSTSLRRFGLWSPSGRIYFKVGE